MRKKSPHHDKEWMVFLAETPVGSLKLYFTDRGLTALEFAGEGASLAPEQDAPPPHLKPLIEAAKRELIAYFNGSAPILPPSPWTPRAPPFSSGSGRNCGASPGARPSPTANWPAGSGNPKASRAVGQANAVNPIPLIIPCHRVIAADGSLGGYSSGLDRKRWLLRHEGVM